MIDEIGQIRKFGMNGVQMRSVISENVGRCYVRSALYFIHDHSNR
jgi:hypothetical protein